MDTWPNELLTALREEAGGIIRCFDNGSRPTDEALRLTQALALCAIAESLAKLARAVEVNGADTPAVRVMTAKEF